MYSVVIKGALLQDPERLIITHDGLDEKMLKYLLSEHFKRLKRNNQLELIKNFIVVEGALEIEKNTLVGKVIAFTYNPQTLEVSLTPATQ